MTLTTLRRFNVTQNIAAWRGGNGPSMVLIHGVGLNADAWYAMLPELLEKYTVTVIDLPGHGDSAAIADATKPSLDAFTSVISDALAKCDGPSVIVGHSMGALIAMDLACNAGVNICGAVALNAIFRRSDTAQQAVKARAKELCDAGVVDNAATLKRWFGENPQGSLQIASDRCEKMMKATHIAGYAAAYTVFSECDGPTDAELKNCKVPMLFMTGAEEPNSTPAMSRAMAALAPNSECITVEGARHMMPITHASQVNHHIEQFLRSREIFNE